jgi:multiple sugar transport system permease protein
MNKTFQTGSAFLLKVVAAAVLAIMVIILIYPFVWMISASFKEVKEMFVIPPTIIPLNPTLNNYQVVWEKMSILANMYKNSILIASAITLIQAIVCSAAGFVFAKLRFPGKNVIFSLFMSSMMVPSFLTIIPNYVTIKNLGLMNSQWSLIVLGSFSVFSMFLVRQFFMGIPQDLHDAARIDGCNIFQSFFYIHLPLARSVIAVSSILTFNAAWGDFFTPLLFLKSIDKMTLPLGISMIQGVYSQQSPTVMVATLVISIVPVVIVFLFARKQLIAGIARTGLKA